MLDIDVKGYFDSSQVRYRIGFGDCAARHPQNYLKPIGSMTDSHEYLFGLDRKADGYFS